MLDYKGEWTLYHSMSGHNMKGVTNYEAFFIGTEIQEFVSSDCADACHTLAKQLTAVTTLPDTMPTKEDMQRDLKRQCGDDHMTVVGVPRVVTWQHFCYCCT